MNGPDISWREHKTEYTCIHEFESIHLMIYILSLSDNIFGLQMTMEGHL